MRKILSIDGGGIRGIIPCLALAELERQTGKQTRDIFELVAGTSTGALLAAAVAVGIPAYRILPIYTERAPKEIFNGHIPQEEMVLRGYRYESAGIAKVLREEFGDAAKWTLNDCPVRLLLTAMHASKTPLNFVQDRPKNSKTFGNLLLVDCATASAAAPTYFSPWYVSPLPKGSKGPFGNELIGHCFDGGLSLLANPAHRACVEAFRNDDFDPADTKVISLGTGIYTPPLEVNPPNGLLPTATFTIGCLLGAAERLQLELIDWYYPGVVRRINPALPRAIDEADMTAIPDLVAVGRAMAASMNWSEILK